MRNLRKWISIVLIPFLMSAPAYGWHDTGHQAVGLVALGQLRPSTRAAVIALLKEHVAYTKGDWPARLQPGDPDGSLFGLAAIFADEVRALESPFHYIHDFEAHFVNLPYLPVRADRRDPTISPRDPNLGQNLTKAYRVHMQTLKNPTATREAKALALSWVFHLLGDIHQPLHGTCMYTQAFKNGDRGANAIKFDPALRAKTGVADLHAFWDALPGEERSFVSAEAKARALVALHPRSQFEKLNATIEECATESFALAGSVAYLGLVDATPLITDLPLGYLATAQKTADRQVALAGYRLAEVLEDLFGE